MDWAQSIHGMGSSKGWVDRWSIDGRSMVGRWSRGYGAESASSPCQTRDITRGNSGHVPPPRAAYFSSPPSTTITTINGSCARAMISEQLSRVSVSQVWCLVNVKSFDHSICALQGPSFSSYFDIEGFRNGSIWGFVRQRKAEEGGAYVSYVICVVCTTWNGKQSGLDVNI